MGQAFKLERQAHRARTTSASTTVLIVGTGLAGASAAATLAEQGYNVKSFCFHDSPRRAHSIAAQGGINAAKNYQNDGDSVDRLFYDTIKGGDFRSREANVYRLAQVSTQIIDQCVAQGVPFAREYGGLLANRSFGGAQVSRTFYARGQTGQQLLLGAYQALERQIAARHGQDVPKTEMLDLVVIDGHAKGIVVRDLVTGEISSHAGDTVVLATGGYGNAYYLSHQRQGLQRHGHLPRPQEGRVLRQPLLHADSSDLHPGGGRVPEQAHADEREPAQRRPRLGAQEEGRQTRAQGHSESERDYYLERKYPPSATSPRATSPRARAKEVCDEGRGVGESGLGVYLDFADSIKRLGVETIRERYGNLFDIYAPSRARMPTPPDADFPGGALHDGRALGGLLPDEQRARPARPGRGQLLRPRREPARRERAHAGLADGYFVLPYTLPTYLAGRSRGRSRYTPRLRARRSGSADKIKQASSIKGKRRSRVFHRELGLLMWDKCGMARNEAGLKEALANSIPQLRAEFWWPNGGVSVPRERREPLTSRWSSAGRVADFLEFGELMCRDALDAGRIAVAVISARNSQIPDGPEAGEALRDDAHFADVAAWEHHGRERPARGDRQLHREPPSVSQSVHLATRCYK